MLQCNFNSLRDEIKNKIESSKNTKELNDAKSYFMGKNGVLTLHMKSLSSLKDVNKKEFGSNINKLKEEFFKLYAVKMSGFENKSNSDKDYTIPAYSQIGRLHPLTLAKEQIHIIMQKMGFHQEIGPSIESEYYNFDALNIHKNHPSRNDRDTFFVKDKLMRTHTTAVQIRALESGKHKDPFRIYSIGDVYRRDDDSTHLPMFHQIEGFVIDPNASIASLKGFLLNFLKKFFNRDDVDIRLRPGYFPFTEPSVEVDVKFDNGKWLEILGAGMIRKNILDKYGYKKGFAFGIGLERVAMIKFGLNNIRNFVENDYPWLKMHSQIDIGE